MSDESLRTESGQGIQERIDTVISGEYSRTMEPELRAAAVLLKYEIQRLLSIPGTGRLYRRRKVRFGKARKDGTRKRLADKASDFHRASAKGSPPAPDTGELKRSAYIEKVGPLAYEVGVAKRYATFLENKLDRQFMKPAMNAWRTKVGRLFSGAS